MRFTIFWWFDFFLVRVLDNPTKKSFFQLPKLIYFLLVVLYFKIFLAQPDIKGYAKKSYIYSFILLVYNLKIILCLCFAFLKWSMFDDVYLFNPTSVWYKYKFFKILLVSNLKIILNIVMYFSIINLFKKVTLFKLKIFFK